MAMEKVRDKYLIDKRQVNNINGDSYPIWVVHDAKPNKFGYHRQIMVLHSEKEYLKFKKK